jgi:ParB family chromosome partitioning protein
MGASAPKHFGTGPVRLAEVVRERQVASAPAIRVPLDLIDPSPQNPRQTLEVAELAASIGAYGLLQPVVVRRTGSRYELVAGHRRHAAYRWLAERAPDDDRWREIDAVLRRADQDQAYLLTLTENLRRHDLSPKEEVAALEVLVRQEGWSVRKVAEAIHREPSYVSRRLRVFDDPVLAPAVLAQSLPVSTAEELLVVPAAERASLVARAVAERWGRPEARRAARERCAAQHPSDELLLTLRAAQALLARPGADAIPEAQRSEARRLLRGLGRALR